MFSLVIVSSMGALNIQTTPYSFCGVSFVANHSAANGFATPAATRKVQVGRRSTPTTNHRSARRSMRSRSRWRVRGTPGSRAQSAGTTPRSRFRAPTAAGRSRRRRRARCVGRPAHGRFNATDRDGHVTPLPGPPGPPMGVLADPAPVQVPSAVP